MRRQIIFGVAAVASLLRGSMLPAATIHVPGDQPTIQAGIDASIQGDTVVVAAGVYTEHITLKNGVAITGELGWTNTYIGPLVPGLSVVTSGAVNDDSTTSISGFTILPASLEHTLRVTGGSPLIANCKILSSLNHYAIVTEGWCQMARVRNILITGDGAGILNNADGTSVIEGNTITRLGGGYGFVVGGGAGAGNIFRNNIVSFNEEYGIYVAGGGVIDLRYNDVFENAWGDYFGAVPGATDFSGDPLFCDTAAGMYTLSNSSPCLGTGEGGANIGAFGIGCTLPAAEQPLVTNIRVDPPADSLHETSPSPQIVWQYFDGQGRFHTKSEIEMGSDNDWTVAEMWDPPEIVGSDTSITYAGAPLIDGTTYYVRVRVFNDTLWSNWLVAPFRMNSVPTVPTLLFPSEGSIAATGRPTLVVMNATDPEGDTRRYDFEVYRDSALTLLTTYISGKVEGVGQTSWKTDSLTAENQRHWWRCRASDGYENGPWSPPISFWVDAYNEPPAQVTLSEPANGAQIGAPYPGFFWSVPADPDPGATLTYDVIVAIDPGFVFKAEVTDVESTFLTWPHYLDYDTYWWKVWARDGRGGSSESAAWQFEVIFPCICFNQADLNSDSAIDAVDLALLIDIVFFGGEDQQDPICPTTRADFDADSQVDAVDLASMIDFVFFGGTGPTDPCN